MIHMVNSMTTALSMWATLTALALIVAMVVGAVLDRAWYPGASLDALRWAWRALRRADRATLAAPVRMLVAAGASAARARQRRAIERARAPEALAMSSGGER
jgi:hypothetical protein